MTYKLSVLIPAREERVYGRIYLLVNTVNGKRYVGQTRQSLNDRWSAHVRTARDGKRYALSCAIRKYGANSFKLIEVDTAVSLDEINTLEPFYIQMFQTLSPKGYNLDSGGRYYETHPETKIKIGLANKGKPSPLKGKKHKPESIQKMRLARLGGPPTRKGKTHTPEAKAKLSAARKGKPGTPHTEEFKIRLSERNKGNTYSLGRKQSPEHVKKRIENTWRTRRLNALSS